ncbi:hypothetical protein KBD34_01135 [Patescibacteria group bacterium]|nr:hypothetical protein [Patescibacteria group bacterium]
MPFESFVPQAPPPHKTLDTLSDAQRASERPTNVNTFPPVDRRDVLRATQEHGQEEIDEALAASVAQSLDGVEKRLPEAIAVASPARRKALAEGLSRAQIVIASAVLSLATALGGAWLSQKTNPEERASSVTSSQGLERLRNKIVDAKEDMSPPVTPPELVEPVIDAAGEGLARSWRSGKILPGSAIDTVIRDTAQQLYAAGQVPTAINREKLIDSLRERAAQTVMGDVTQPLERRTELLDAIQEEESAPEVSYAFLAAKHEGTDRVTQLLYRAFDPALGETRTTQQILAWRFLGQRDLSRELIEEITHHQSIHRGLVAGLIEQRNSLMTEAMRRALTLQNNADTLSDDEVNTLRQERAHDMAEYLRVSHLLDQLMPHVGQDDQHEETRHHHRSRTGRHARHRP